jgi:hypothetical protein
MKTQDAYAKSIGTPFSQIDSINPASMVFA